jgi:hypothetical protein
MGIDKKSTSLDSNLSTSPHSSFTEAAQVRFKRASIPPYQWDMYLVHDPLQSWNGSVEMIMGLYYRYSFSGTRDFRLIPYREAMDAA